MAVDIARAPRIADVPELQTRMEMLQLLMCGQQEPTYLRGMHAATLALFGCGLALLASAACLAFAPGSLISQTLIALVSVL